MKRFLTLMVAAALCLGMVAPASAIDLNAKGDFHFAGIFRDNNNFSHNEADHFWVQQRVRVQLEFIASENLKGVLNVRNKGNMRWGREAHGAALDANTASMMIRQAYVDWKVPNTGLNILVGIRHLTLPGAVAGSPVINDAGAGLTLSYKFNETATLSAIWFRPSDESNNPHDQTDLFVLSLPLSFDGVSVNPWAVYGRDGQDGLYTAFGNENHANIWFGGVAAEVKVFDPLTLAADVMYGAIKRSGDGFESSGWFADFRAAYKLSLGTVALTAWYATGDDKDDYKKNESGRMPSMAIKGDTESTWKVSSFGAMGHSPIIGGNALTRSGVGTWGVGLSWENVSFIEDLFHTVRVLYWEGTNDEETRAGWGDDLYNFGEMTRLTKEDYAIEVNFDHRYNISKNLRLDLNLAYIYIDWDDDYRDGNSTIAYGNRAVNQFRAGLGFYYSF